MDQEGLKWQEEIGKLKGELEEGRKEREKLGEEIRGKEQMVKDREIKVIEWESRVNG